MVKAVTANDGGDLESRKLTAHEANRINRQIDSFVQRVSPSAEIMTAIQGTYQYLREAIERSGTIRRKLNCNVNLYIYGSVANGLFDV